MTKMIGAHALSTFVGWLRAVRNSLAEWLSRGTRKAERKKTQRRDTDQRLRREGRGESTDDDR
jgi:hypothetical protein